MIKKIVKFEIKCDICGISETSDYSTQMWPNMIKLTNEGWSIDYYCKTHFAKCPNCVSKNREARGEN